MINEIEKQKKKRYWLIGGIIGLVIGEVIILYSNNLLAKCFILIPAFIVSFLMNREGNPSELIILFIAVLFFYFIIGSLIGIVISEIKQKKTK